MAKMIPDIPVNSIENLGERLFYVTAKTLPGDYTVFYSYKFAVSDGDKDSIMREADFVIVHPALGYVVVEVKQNNVGFHNGQWHEFKQSAQYSGTIPAQLREEGIWTSKSLDDLVASNGDVETFYSETLPNAAFDYYSCLAQSR
ncbi:MAG: NERD domain-containing protein [Bacillota bacterium]|nr:NERD domain-containing protein [Bacillota bacterium]